MLNDGAPALGVADANGELPAAFGVPKDGTAPTIQNQICEQSLRIMTKGC